MHRWGPLLTPPSPIRVERCLHRKVPVPWDTSALQGAERKGGARPAGSSGSEHGQGGLPQDLSCPATPRSVGHVQYPQDTHSYTQVHPQTHTPGDLAHRHECTPRNIPKDSHPVLRCVSLQWLSLLAPEWHLGTTPLWSEPHFPPAPSKCRLLCPFLCLTSLSSDPLPRDPLEAPQELPGLGRVLKGPWCFWGQEGLFPSCFPTLAEEELNPWGTGSLGGTPGESPPT